MGVADVSGALGRVRGVAEADREIAERTRPFEGARSPRHSKNTYWGVQYRRLLPYLGPKRAAMAVAHSICPRLWIVLARGEPYADLGGEHFIQRDREAVKRKAIANLQGLGYAVTLTSCVG